MNARVALDSAEERLRREQQVYKTSEHAFYTTLYSAGTSQTVSVSSRLFLLLFIPVAAYEKSLLSQREELHHLIESLDALNLERGSETQVSFVPCCFR